MTTGVATLASGANYLLVSGLKPRGKLGKRLMVQRENLQERYREREVLVREKMGVGRERMRVRQVRAARLLRCCCAAWCACRYLLCCCGTAMLLLMSLAVQFLPRLCCGQRTTQPSE